MNSMTRIISRALVASLLVFIAACSDSGDGVLYSGDLPSAPEASTPAPEPSPGNIVEVATSTMLPGEGSGAGVLASGALGRSPL